MGVAHSPTNDDIMNPKNLEGKTPAQIKDMYEVELIADFEMQYGDPGNWSDEETAEFDAKWDEIQNKYKI